jgi:hypothetical protein
MNQKTRDMPPASGKKPLSFSEEVGRQIQKAEQREIAGRHKNSGQKDHKGAR